MEDEFKAFLGFMNIQRHQPEGFGKVIADYFQIGYMRQLDINIFILCFNFPIRDMGIL